MEKQFSENAQFRYPEQHRYLIEGKYIVLNNKNTLQDEFWRRILSQTTSNLKNFKLGNGDVSFILKNNGEGKKLSVFIMSKWANIISFNSLEESELSEYDIGVFTRYAVSIIRDFQDDHRLINTANFKMFLYTKNRVKYFDRVQNDVCKTVLGNEIVKTNEHSRKITFDSYFNVISENTRDDHRGYGWNSDRSRGLESKPADETRTQPIEQSFGDKPSQPFKQSLFGDSKQSQPFGDKPSQPFEDKQPQSSQPFGQSLFGDKQSQPFGQAQFGDKQSQSSQPFGQSLFGNKQSQPFGQSLFGDSKQSQPFGQSLFG